MPAKKTALKKSPAKTGKTVATKKKTPAAKSVLKTGTITRPAAKKNAVKPMAKPAVKKAPAKKSAKSVPKKTGKLVAKKTAGKATKPAAKKVSVAKETKAAAGLLNKEGLELVKKCVRALDDKKAESLRVLYVGEKSSVTDFFVVATGNSEPHLRALRIAVEKELDDENALIIGKESQPESGWCVVDAFDVIVHLFLPGQRENYQLESLWKDGEDLPVAELLK